MTDPAADVVRTVENILTEAMVAEHARAVRATRLAHYHTDRAVVAEALHPQRIERSTMVAIRRGVFS